MLRKIVLCFATTFKSWYKLYLKPWALATKRQFLWLKPMLLVFISPRAEARGYSIITFA